MYSSVIKASLLSLVSSLCFLSSVQAADMLADNSIVYDESNASATTQVEYGTGWYLRGDLGIGYSTYEGADDYGTFSFDHETSGSLTIGAGYKVSELFRAELGINHFWNLGFEDNSAIDCGTEDHDGQPLSPEFAIGGDCSSRVNGASNITSFMVNGYIDLPASEKLRPYVGAGLGIAKVNWDELSYGRVCEGTQTNDCGIAQTTKDQFTTVSYTEESEYKFAFNVMAGLSYQVSDNTFLDLGYRYTKVTDFDNTALVGESNVNNFDVGDVDIHELRFGLRYEIW